MGEAGDDRGEERREGPVRNYFSFLSSWLIPSNSPHKRAPVFSLAAGSTMIDDDDDDDDDSSDSLAPSPWCTLFWKFNLTKNRP